ncbi:hypothetical protein [Legionella shakespearei]|uniref:Uncharacterized protein n=1 Tax=Legionella shakespearei DSM 23087 TaxID=1122169 RepID=A0A0W0Z338_9GAMM|nr:hypothetical protein [Legionella shakespearei]KTD63219.1 hypothetical protein Lsha_0771 [Legionella shakespearei DSM 23087]
MSDLDSRERTVINAIQRNHQRLLQSKMVTHFGVYFELAEHPEKIYSWIEKIDDTRLLANEYLDSLVQVQPPPTTAQLESETSGLGYYLEKAKLLFPEGLRSLIFNTELQDEGFGLFHLVSTELFSLTLGKSITEVLFDYFQTQFNGNQEEAQKQFAAVVENQSELSNLIKQECKRISIELIKLFHFREMLLLGKMSRSVTEPEVREEFIQRAKLKNQSAESINIAIEVYFARELSHIFNSGFQSLYQVHDVEIRSELQSPFIKWLNQLSESEKIRLAFTQEIQLKFMVLSRDFLLEKMNEPGFLAKHSKTFSLIAATLTAPIIAISLVLMLGTAFMWIATSVAAASFALAGIAAYFAINKLDAIAYKRNLANRTQIQNAITLVNNEFLRLKKEMIERKETSTETIENTRDFGQINRKFLRTVEGAKVARGSISGWLREYASRYRHSKAVVIDLGDEYKQLMIQSRNQTEELIDSINNKETHLLKNWILGTKNYLNKASHRELIKDFELIPKFKEQVLEIISQTHYIPPTLLHFYCSPIAAGGLGGNESDFAHVKRLIPTKEKQNPYQFLCDTALNLFKHYEPLYASKLIFLGDPEYRQMLGISRAEYGEPVTAENIDSYLKNSYAFLLSLCGKIAPGLGLDPLQQPARVSDEFILYRMLLLKQLATLARSENKEVNSEVKLKIKRFIQNRFNQDIKILFDNLANQMFLLNKEIQTSLTYKNSDQFVVTDVELDNIIQAIRLDVVYNSFSFRLMDVLTYYIDDFLRREGKRKCVIFACNRLEQELNPQGTRQFVTLVTDYCTNTSDFLNASTKNRALTATNILECYRYNISLQVYRTQIRIIKNMKELYQSESGAELSRQLTLLFEAFKTLTEFAQKHCFHFRNNAPCSELFSLVQSKINQSGTRYEWIKHLDSNEALVYMMDTLAEQVQLPSAGSRYKGKFFNPQLMVNSKGDKEKAYAILSGDIPTP